jgi:cell division septal protein FtsQ
MKKKKMNEEKKKKKKKQPKKKNKKKNKPVSLLMVETFTTSVFSLFTAVSLPWPCLSLFNIFSVQSRGGETLSSILLVCLSRGR